MLVLLGGQRSYAQESTFVSGKEYTLDSIQVVGLKSFNEKTVIFIVVKTRTKVRLLEIKSAL